MSVGDFRDTHVVSLPSQGNVYSLGRLSVCHEPCKVLVASLKRKVYCLEYKTVNGIIHPLTKEVQFTYIPATAEILSIDCFNRSQKNKDFVIGITIIKNEENSKSQYVLNIYSECDPSESFSLDQVAQSCIHVPLNFIPYQLKHTRLLREHATDKEVAWLLSGSDSQLHLFCEDPMNNSYTEYPVHNYYPEFQSIPSIVLWMDIVQLSYNGQDWRLSAVGCENGYVKVSLFNESSREIVEVWEIQQEGPVTSLHFFHIPSSVECPPNINTNMTGGVLQHKYSETSPSFVPEVQLLVTNSLDESVVYSNILVRGLDKDVPLQESDKFDCVICSCVADVNMDGVNEIILGTFGQTLLMYVHQPGGSPEWVLQKQYSFANPLHAVSYCDVTGDGVKELIVLSTKGLHILQHDLQKVSKLCLSRLQQLVDETVT